MDQDHLVPRRSGPGSAPEEDRRPHVDEGKRDELGEPAGAVLDQPQDFEMVGPGNRSVDVSEHDRRRRAQAHLVGHDHHMGPLGGRDLVGTEVGSNPVVEDLGRGPRQRAQSGFLEPRQELGDTDPEGLGSLPHLQRRKPVHMHVGHGLLDRLHHRYVEVAGEFGMNTALEAHLGGPRLPCFLGPVGHLVNLQQIWITSEIQ